MERLKLSDIAGYLPYGLNVLYKFHEIDICRIKGIQMNEFNNNEYVIMIINDLGEVDHSHVSCSGKPILRPMSDLIKVIAVIGEQIIALYILDPRAEARRVGKECRLMGRYGM